MTIIGNGDIAGALRDREGFIFFASGVSNSNETREAEYQREVDLLLKQPRDKHFVYFSSLCIFNNPKTRYSWHKRHMEELVRYNFPNYTIVRLGNCEWGDNPHHLIYFIKDKVKKNEKFEIYDEYRNPLSKEEFQYWMNLIPDWNCEFNITGRLMKVKDIVEEIKYEYT